ncbi:lipopolysaccharide biosynthesis protein [Spirosoma horti]
MSTASRVISGSAASWAQIAVTMVSQIALVPIYLSHWNVVTYGVWLSTYAMISILSIVDFGHQEFLGYEFLRIGKNNNHELSNYLWSGISINILINLAEVLLIIILLNTDALAFLISKSKNTDSTLIHDAGLVLLFQSFTWPVFGIAGIFFRALAPYGHSPRMFWWNFLTAIVNSAAPITAVILGADLLTTGLITACAITLFNIPIYIDLYFLARKEKIRFSKPSWKLGSYNFVRSLAIFGKVLLENVRQQGVRLFLAPLAGATGLVAFSTMRTGANVALQGLRTITNPLMPELVRFLHQRDQDRVDASFGIIWIMVVALIAPAIVVLQAVVEPLYTIWTRGQVPFDPLLFAILSLAILVYAVAQPAMAVVIGNNMLKPQVVLPALAAFIVVAGLFILVPDNGILGAGVALLLAEIAAAIGYKTVAERWLENNDLRWPTQPFRIAVTAIWIAALAMGAMTQFPQMKWMILVAAIVLFSWNFWRYWQILPSFATDRIRKLLMNLPGVRKMQPVDQLSD